VVRSLSTPFEASHLLFPSSQSPRANRSSTNDAEAYSKGSVQTGFDSPHLEENEYEPTKTPDQMYEIDGYEPHKV
jgi:hypothetical protein